VTIAKILLSLLGLGRDVLGWLFVRPVRLLVFVLLLACLWLWTGRERALALAEHRRIQAANWYAKFIGQRTEMRKFVVKIRTVRAEAARIDRENIARVKREWAARLDEVKYDYAHDLAANRAALARRLSPAPADPGNAGGGGAAAVSAIPVLSTGPLRAGRTAIVDVADADACTVNTVRLDHLIAAWRSAAAIDPNGAAQGGK
jgi:hypothetical protein